MRLLRERVLVSGPGSLSDSELVALLVHQGDVGFSDQILGCFNNSLSELAAADVVRIRQSAGCGVGRAVSLVVAAEFSRRVSMGNALSVSVVGSTNDVVEMFSSLGDLPHEEFWVLYLTSGGRVLDRVRVSQGGVSGTVVDRKLVVKRALELLAGSIILVHNHPSGVAVPSGGDLELTTEIRSAALFFDILLVDHIILAKGGVYSFAAAGVL